MYDMCLKMLSLYHNIYDMNRIWFLLVLLINSWNAFSQDAKLPAKTIQAFAEAYNYHFQYGRDMFKVAAMEAARNIGIYKVSDMHEAVQNLKSATNFRNSLLRRIGSYSGYRYDFIYTTLTGMGIDPTYSNTLAEYIISIQNSQQSKNIETARSDLKSLLPPPSNVFNYKYQALLDSFKRNEIPYTQDSSIIDDTFIGFDIKTRDGEYFIQDNFRIGSYKLEIPKTMTEVTQYFLSQGAKLKQKESYYYLYSFKGFIVQVMKMSDFSVTVTYNRAH